MKVKKEKTRYDVNISPMVWQVFPRKTSSVSMSITTCQTSIGGKKRNFNQLHLCKKYYNTQSLTHHFHLFYQQLKMKPSHITSKLSRLTVIVSGAASALTDGMAHVLIAVRWMPRYVEGMSCDHVLSLVQNCTCWELRAHEKTVTPHHPLKKKNTLKCLFPNWSIFKQVAIKRKANQVKLWEAEWWGKGGITVDKACSHVVVFPV